jgi:hypothetical protein
MRWNRSAYPVAQRMTSRLRGPAPVLAGVTVALAATAVLGAQQVRTDYPLDRQALCGGGLSCEQAIDEWNDATWDDTVDEVFATTGPALAAVRWYNTEGNCTGTLCKDQLHACGGPQPPDPATSHFCGVTDELGNVLLSHAMGTDQSRYERLHRFTELLRVPTVDPDDPGDLGLNGLQCWKYRVVGSGTYDDYDDLCIEDDSASDASVRILGAYGIACAKQRAGVWEPTDVDFCADYVEQGKAIWGLGTIDHGEVRVLSSGKHYLATGYNNYAGAPTAAVSFRADYLELQFLMDFAEYMQDSALVQGVEDMLDHYLTAADLSPSGNHFHRGKTGHFADEPASTYVCDAPDTTTGECGSTVPAVSLCRFVDQFDTWRAVPALSGLRNVHPEAVAASVDADIFQYWWDNFAGGHPTLYGATATKPIEIWVDQSDGTVRCTDDSYKTMGMWIPLGAALDSTYTSAAVAHLIGNRYDSGTRQFGGAAYYGAYYSQFAQRAVGAATGMIDPAYWAARPVARQFFTVTPCRVLDTRSGSPYPTATQQTVTMVGGVCGVPAGAEAVAINVTATGATAAGHLVLFPGDAVVPVASTLNFAAGQTRANNAVVALASNGAGTIAIQPNVAAAGTVHVVVDVVGYFD